MWPFKTKVNPEKHGVVLFCLKFDAGIKSKKLAKALKKLGAISFRKYSELGYVDHMHSPIRQGIQARVMEISDKNSVECFLQYVRGDWAIKLYTTEKLADKFRQLARKHSDVIYEQVLTADVLDTVQSMEKEEAEVQVRHHVYSKIGTPEVKKKRTMCGQCSEKVVPDSDLDCPECGCCMFDDLVDMDKSMNYFIKHKKVKVFAA